MVPTTKDTVKKEETMAEHIVRAAGRLDGLNKKKRTQNSSMKVSTEVDRFHVTCVR